MITHNSKYVHFWELQRKSSKKEIQILKSVAVAVSVAKRRKNCRHTKEVSRYFRIIKLNLVISGSCNKTFHGDSNTEACCLGQFCCKIARMKHANLGISGSYKQQFLKVIQILRPVAESVAKMLRGRGREDCRHTQVLLDILMRTDSSSN